MIEQPSEAAEARTWAVAPEEADTIGFYGRAVDPTPRHHYSISGRAAGLPTPESDEAQAHLAWRRARENEWWYGSVYGPREP